jgi:hypothetical protein
MCKADGVDPDRVGMAVVGGAVRKAPVWRKYEKYARAVIGAEEET